MNRMTKTLHLLLISAFLLAGCAPKSTSTPAPETSASTGETLTSTLLPSHPSPTPGPSEGIR